MKKKLLASLLVSSAVVGASLAPLSAQAVTTGNTPVQVELGGGTLPDGGGGTNTVRPDPDATNSDFDLLFIPNEYNFGKLSISDDLTKPIPLRETGYYGHGVGVGDLRGTKEGWHLTAQSDGMKQGSEQIQGSINVGSISRRLLKYNETTNIFQSVSNTGEVPLELWPEASSYTNWSVDLGGDAKVLANATAGRGQGTWKFLMEDTTLNITTPYQQIKAGAYTGNVTWNLVAGPSI
ncbi:WxL domain-containing protein [Enterococcus faecalis]|uniref:WxL domain-containing protein n=1 Tax=Enterococcus faecalis TaxID=1351 RepID=UPI0017841391|nr:WxL domain-containing protein [Enterococcus faecalis]MBD9892221.1 WxL domain-containing protein [Enterococcus faecalis]MCD5102785.1 WxL domain-containing protein [Enterococcus faecalis]MDJ9021893.1 WxL domain-containing protein [Enterococcus faecalis]MDK0467645.1 WxL domain-containing protein [Enterococcus faecalis]